MSTHPMHSNLEHATYMAAAELKKVHETLLMLAQEVSKAREERKEQHAVLVSCISDLRDIYVDASGDLRTSIEEVRNEVQDLAAELSSSAEEVSKAVLELKPAF